MVVKTISRLRIAASQSLAKSVRNTYSYNVHVQGDGGATGAKRIRSGDEVCHGRLKLPISGCGLSPRRERFLNI